MEKHVEIEDIEMTNRTLLDTIFENEKEMENGSAGKKISPPSFSTSTSS